MTNAYRLLASTTLETATSSVVFSSIPGSFTDLLLKIGARDTTTGSTITSGSVRINGSIATNNSYTSIKGTGSSVTTNRRTSVNGLEFYYPGSNASMTTLSFSNTDFYFPNYTNATTKSIGLFTSTENMDTNAELDSWAHQTQNTNPITSLEIIGNQFQIGSTFYLYGIKNS
jgi:hypothetical protein